MSNINFRAGLAWRCGIASLVAVGTIMLSPTRGLCTDPVAEAAADETETVSPYVAEIEKLLDFARLTNGVRRTQILKRAWITYDPETLVTILENRLDAGDSLLVAEACLHGGENGTQFLLSKLTSSEPAVGDQIAHSLAEIGSIAVPVFERALHNQDATVRIRAVRGLGWIQTSGSAGVLGNQAYDLEPEVRFEAVEALGVMTPAARGANLGRFANDELAVIRLRVAEFSAHEKDAGSGESLSRLAMDRESSVRTAAVVGLREHPMGVGVALEGLLEDPVEAIRAEAGRGLTEQLPDAGKAGLLSHPDPVVQRAVVETLLDSPDTSLEVLGKMAELDDAEARQLALTRIVRSNEPGAGQAAQAFLTDPFEEIQLRALAFILEKDGAKNPELLLPVARGGSPEAQRQAIAALSLQGTVEASGVLTRFLEASDPQARLAAAEYVRDHASPASIQAMSRLNDDPSAKVRLAALQAVARQQSGAAMNHVATYLDDPSPLVRQGAARALGRYRNPEVVMLLARHSDDPDVGVRGALLGALIEIGDDVAAGGISEFLSDSDEELRFDALEGLSKIGSPMAIALIGEVFLLPDTSLRRVAIRTLEDARMNHTEAVARALSNFLHDPNVTNQTLAIEASAMTGNGEAIAGLLELAREQRTRSRRQAVWALQWVRDADAVAALETLVDDPDMMVRRNAYKGLARLGGQRGYELLIDGLDDSMEMVRISVAQSIGSLRLGMAVSQLADRVQIASILEQKAIIDALVEIGSPEATEALIDLATSGRDLKGEVARHALEQIGQVELSDDAVLKVLLNDI